MKKYLYIDRVLNGGQQKVYKFENGFGASVVKNAYSYGGSEGKWELAVLKFEGEYWDITYDTEITDDVIGYLNEDKIEDILRRIQAI